MTPWPHDYVARPKHDPETIGVSKQSHSDPDLSSARKAPRLVYAGLIALDRAMLNVDGNIVNLTPGMAATVEIKIGKRKLIEFVLSPLLKMTGEAGRER